MPRGNGGAWGGTSRQYDDDNARDDGRDEEEDDFDPDDPDDPDNADEDEDDFDPDEDEDDEEVGDDDRRESLPARRGAQRTTTAEQRPPTGSGWSDEDAEETALRAELDDTLGSDVMDRFEAYFERKMHRRQLAGASANAHVRQIAEAEPELIQQYGPQIGANLAKMNPRVAATKEGVVAAVFSAIMADALQSGDIGGALEKAVRARRRAGGEERRTEREEAPKRKSVPPEKRTPSPGPVSTRPARPRSGKPDSDVARLARRYNITERQAEDLLSDPLMRR